MSDEPGAAAGRDVHDDETDAFSDGAAWVALPRVLDAWGADDGELPARGEGPVLVGRDRRLHSDPHDFAGLYLRHRSAFTLHARHYLRDERDADDVVQEAFLRLFLALPELETELQALAYCRRTITNLCIDRYRAQGRRPHLVHLDSVPLEEIPDEDAGDPVVRAEDAALVREALSLLSPMHRAALVKREIEEKTVPVIADELAIPEESVKHLLFRARRALRRLLAGTSLAPGADGERARAPRATARVGAGGPAALVLAVVLGIGSGPNLEAIPVVGVDLPAVIDVTSFAQTVETAVARAVDAAPGSGGAGDGAPVQGAQEPAPRPAAPPSASADSARLPAAPPSAGADSARLPSRAPAPPSDVTPAPAPVPQAAPVPPSAPSPQTAPRSQAGPVPGTTPAFPRPERSSAPAAVEQGSGDSSAGASSSSVDAGGGVGPPEEDTSSASALPSTTPSGGAGPAPAQSPPEPSPPAAFLQSSPTPAPTAVPPGASETADALGVDRPPERTRSASSEPDAPAP